MLSSFFVNSIRLGVTLHLYIPGVMVIEREGLIEARQDSLGYSASLRLEPNPAITSEELEFLDLVATDPTQSRGIRSAARRAQKILSGNELRYLSEFRWLRGTLPNLFSLSKKTIEPDKTFYANFDLMEEVMSITTHPPACAVVLNLK